ncbi:HAD-like domain protein [Vibrio phage 2.275.O._10N.286.54.E11]|nr:HAD-like domain protein [Vibrio phage 2.275.O._10N.286.54.E11]
MQASGKTTWAKELCKHMNRKGSQNRLALISRDEYRDMLAGGIENYTFGNKFSTEVESMITDAAVHQAELAVAKNLNIVIADMNLNPATQRSWEKFAKKNNMKVEKKDFYAEWLATEGSKFDLLVAEDKYLELMIERDLKRPNSLGHEVLTNTFNKYLRSELIQHEHIPGLPSAVIFDVDGTLAEMNGRMPYQWKRVGEDTVRENVARVLRMHHAAGDKIIILSGRDGSCQPETEKWLKDNNLHYDHIWMRAPKDQRKDSIIKNELIDDHVNGVFNVHCVYDDRDQVVLVHRRKGLDCFQVAPGAF